MSHEVRHALASASASASADGFVERATRAGGLGALSTARRSPNWCLVPVDDDRQKAFRQVAILVASHRPARVETEYHEIVAQASGLGASAIPAPPLQGDPETFTRARSAMGSSSTVSPEAGARGAVRETRHGPGSLTRAQLAPPDSRQPKVTRRIATLALLMVLAIGLLTAVPALRPVIRTIDHINPVWIAVAIALELASCVSFVILFRLFFDRLSRREARALAWTEMASGALLPGGGAGGLAIGGWLIHLTGAPTGWIIRRSGGLFFLTTAVNSLAIISCGLLLWVHAAQPHRLTLSALPAGLALVATLPVAALPRLLRSRTRAPRWVAGISAGVLDAEQTTFEHPSWRLTGALGYLGFDMAVLWVTLHAVGEPVSIPALVLAYNIGYLANALPIPGGIGVLDAGLAGSLLLYGASPVHVTAAVLVYHAIALWIPGLGGTIAYLRVRARLTRAPSVETH